MELNHDQVYSHWRQRVAWWNHYLKAALKHKERNRVKMLSKLIPHGGVILDVGAHFGYLAKEFCKIHDKSCRVYCFEPISYTYSILTRVMRKFDNAIIEKIGLSYENGLIKITIPVKESGRLGIGLTHFGGEPERDYILEEINIIRLDGYCVMRNINRLDFIKCDVEGAEYSVFKGGEVTLKRFMPIIYTEIKQDFARRIGHDASDIISLLENIGYSTNYYNNGEIIRVKEYSDKIEDYLFIPSNT